MWTAVPEGTAVPPFYNEGKGFFVTRNVLSRFAHRLDQQNTQSFAYQLIVPVLVFFAVWNLIPVQIGRAHV